MKQCKKIPYGLTDFKRIQTEHYYYVDKTRYIPLIEAAGNYLFFIRPRRFGKSLRLNMLECYYDIARKHEFDELFAGTFIHTRPTVLYFIQEFLDHARYPEDMIDQNVKIDYSKLRHLIVLDQQLNGNFLRLEKIIETGELESDVVKSFPVEHLTNPTNFISLLFYFGLLSYAGTRTLSIPNHTVRTLMYGYLRDGYEDVDVFRIDRVDFANLIHNMAYKGEWKNVFLFLANEVDKQTRIRDYLTGEKVIRTFLSAYLNVVDLYLTRTEEEMGKGFADMYLEPFLPRKSISSRSNDSAARPVIS